MKAEKDTAVLYVHGKGGSAAEAEHYRALFPQAEVYGFDYRAETPWDAKEEFSARAAELRAAYSRVLLVANSIGAYFSRLALPDQGLQKALFVSPVVNMERLILDMMDWAEMTETQLRDAGEIATDFGQTLSWQYLSWVREHPLNWHTPTAILYAGHDNLTSRDTITAFANAHQASLSVYEPGEHWFHTPDQLDAMTRWEKSEI